MSSLSGETNRRNRVPIKTILRPSPTNRYGSTLRESNTPPEPKGHWSFLFLLITLICCGGPFIILALFAASGTARGITAGVVIALIAAAALTVVRRRQATNCCVTPTVKDRQ